MAKRTDARSHKAPVCSPGGHFSNPAGGLDHAAPIIDSHVHWRDPRKNPYEVLSDAVGADGERAGSAAQAYLPEDYLADAQGYGIAAVVHIEAEWSKSDPVGETRWLHDLIRNDAASGLAIVGVAFCDLSRRRRSGA